MAKELDKFKKEWASLEKQAGKCEADYNAHTTNREHHKGILLESSKEIGRVVQELKNGGATGTKLADFANAKELAPVIKTAQTALAALGKEETRLKKVLKDTKDAIKLIAKLESQIDSEIKSRKKKKDRKLLSVDSKSLPDMEKLLPKVATRKVDLGANTIDMQEIEKWSLATEKSNFDKWTKAEIAQTKSDRKGRDQSETDSRAFDVRILKKQMGVTKKIVTGVQTACAKAERHFKNRETTEADRELQKAWDLHEQLKKVYAPYQRKMSNMNKWDKLGLQQTKDGKYVLSSVDQMKNALDALSKLIKKISRATV